MKKPAVSCFRKIRIGAFLFIFMAILCFVTGSVAAKAQETETSLPQESAGEAVSQETGDESARDQKAEKVVRVGWYDSLFNRIDRSGRRSGYAYEYQQKIAAYTGWKYEYVEGSWRELVEMLKKGEIDLMSDVSYLEERAQYMLFPSFPMGTEEYYVYTTADNDGIILEDYTSLNGKRIGVVRDSIQVEIFREWAKSHGVKAELIEQEGSDKDALKQLHQGLLDAVVTLDVYGDPDTAVPVCKIGSSDYYFVVSKNRPDLLTELDAALGSIQDENRYYNMQMFKKYLSVTAANPYLSTCEKAWLVRHGPIRVGYQDNYLAFCAKDNTTGELVGALKDYLDYASANVRNAYLKFEPVGYPTAAAAMEALQKGEVDCMFPANLTAYDGEMLDVVMTPALMRTGMDAVVRAADQKSFLQKQQVMVAVNEGNPNYDMFLMDNYPGWDSVYYKDTPACLQAVADGRADCIIISNYRFNNISRQCESLKLTTVSTGVDLDYCFAVRRGDTELYSILAWTAGVVPESTMNASLTYYSTEDAKTGFADFILDNLATVVASAALVVLVILVLLLRSMRAEKKAIAEEKLVDDLNRRVYVDPLTSVRNKGAFSVFIEELQQRADQEGSVLFAAGVFDCDDLKLVNDRYGHDKGDLYLKAASRLMKQVFKNSPVFRIGGDEFVVILQGEDYLKREELIDRFEKARDEACAAAEYTWDEIRISLGVAAYDPRVDHAVMDTVRRADKIMYANKRRRKKQLR